METTALRPLLKSLCGNSVWNYAVLWKLRHQNPVILSWEDGCFNYPKTKSNEIVSDDTCYQDTISPAIEANISNGNNLEDYFVRLLMADESSLQYTMGDGVVGKVASTKDHIWVSFDDIFSGEVKCPEEWLPQFASGIKTILLVPVLPHGVLQLGSLEEVFEDIDIVAYVKNKFDSLSDVWDNTTPFPIKNECEIQLLSNFIKNSDASIPNAFTSVKSEYFGQSDNLSIMNQDLIQLTAQYASILTGKNLQEPYSYAGDNTTDIPLTSLVEIENSSSNELMECKLLDLSSLMEEIQAHSDCFQFNEAFLGESLSRITGSHPIENFTGETSTGKSCLKLNKRSELHKAVEQVNEKQPNEIFSDTALLSEDASDTNKNHSERTDLSWFASGADTGYLLEHVIARACTDTEKSYGTGKNFMACNNFWGNFMAKSNTSSFSSDDSTLWSHLTSAASVTGCNAANSTPDDLKGTIFGEGAKGGDSDGVKLVESSQNLNTSKRRARAGDNQKPRPRDRQLIQDRVKELRELVPNTAKCSIDSLLDRTVNHMLYLRSVADQADKLRQCTPKQLAGRTDKRSAETNEDCTNGTSWAFEVSNEYELCPIFVEDLNYPGCMLIEILCNDNALFLDIAETIRNLDLTILKGVQVRRSDNNTWAQFIVEVSKGFHRLDIFWPLMQLLQRKRKPISSRI